MANMNTIVKDIVKKYKIPSMSVMVLKDEKVLLHSYFGVRKIEDNEEVTANDLFHLGSCSKSFCASLILKLMDEKKLDLEDSAVKYLRNLDQKKFSDIKIKHLLSHTAGIISNVDDETWNKIFSLDILPSQGREIVATSLNLSNRLAFGGEIFEYSNVGYILLAQIVESLERKSFEEVLVNKLFKPLNMTSCIFGPVGRDRKTLGPWPHKYIDGKFVSIDPLEVFSDNPPAYNSAGVISCSQKDWAKFIKMILNVGDEKSYLSSKAREYLKTVDLEDYTYGAWGRFERDWSGTLLVHSGSNNFNYSYAMLGIDQKFAFLINTNSPCQEAVLEIVSVLKDYYLSLSR